MTGDVRASRPRSQASGNARSRHRRRVAASGAVGHRTAAFDPDVPSQAVGSWPTLDLARFGLDRVDLPPLGWVFVGAAIAVGLLRLPALAASAAEFLSPSLARWPADVLVAATPAALLWRIHDAQRTRPILLAGLAIVTVKELVEAAAAFWPGGLDGSGWRGTPIDILDAMLAPIGYLLVGLGLIGLLARTPARLGGLVAIAAVFLGIPLGSLWIEMTYSQSAFDFGPLEILRLVAIPLATAFAAWVPVSAWLDGASDREFWSYLALAVVFELVVLVFEVPQTVIVVILRSNALFPAAVLLYAGTSLIVAILGLYAYGRLTPMPPAEPLPGDLPSSS